MNTFTVSSPTQETKPIKSFQNLERIPRNVGHPSILIIDKEVGADSASQAAPYELSYDEDTSTQTRCTRRRVVRATVVNSNTGWISSPDPDDVKSIRQTKTF